MWENDAYHLRWFTPGGEIDLCGHATLAAAYAITRFAEPNSTIINFDTKSGRLTVKKENDLFEMDFPAYELHSVEVTYQITQAIGVRPLETWMGRDLLCVLESEESVQNLKPDLSKLLELDGLLLHVTAQGKEYDCVSRTFAPKLNVPEDPVCGSGPANPRRKIAVAIAEVVFDIAYRRIAAHLRPDADTQVGRVHPRVVGPDLPNDIIGPEHLARLFHQQG